MRYFVCILCILFSWLPIHRIPQTSSHAILVDTHNDVLSGSCWKESIFLKGLSKGIVILTAGRKVEWMFNSFLFGPMKEPSNKEGFFKDAQQEIDSLDLLVLRNPARILLAQSFHDVKKGIRQGKLVALIGVEGGHMIEESLEKLQELRTQGMRYMTLTWNNSTSWATSACDETAISDSIAKGMISNEASRKKGLTAFREGSDSADE